MAKERKKDSARSYEELAALISQQLNISLTAKTIQRWRKDPRYKDHCPQPRSGRHHVPSWVKFILRFGLKRADEAVARDEVPEEQRTIRDWKEYREQLLCRQLERSIFRNDRLLLVATELEIALGATFAAINAKLQQFAYRAARFLVMCRDEIEAEEKLHYQMEAILKDLNAAEFIDNAVDDLPVEQREIARAALRGIGQRALRAADQDPDISEKKPGNRATRTRKRGETNAESHSPEGKLP